MGLCSVKVCCFYELRLKIVLRDLDLVFVMSFYCRLDIFMKFLLMVEELLFRGHIVC